MKSSKNSKQALTCQGLLIINNSFLQLKLALIQQEKSGILCVSFKTTLATSFELHRAVDTVTINGSKKESGLLMSVDADRAEQS